MSKYMPRLRFLLLAGIATRITLAAVPGAWAETPGDAGGDGRPVLSTRSFAGVAPGAAIAVEPRDDTDANLHLRDLMAARLAAQQHPARADAPLRLRFSTETLSNAGPRQGAATGDTTFASDRQPFAATNLNYSEADRFFAPSNDRAARAAIQNSFQLRATLETRDGRVLWSGDAHAALSERNEQRVGADLAEALTDALGRTVDTVAPAQAAANSTPGPAPATQLGARPGQPTTLGGLRLPGLSLPELAERR
jgi:hypothetical protein